MSDTGRQATTSAQAIVVAGMHRSGTSAFTRVVSLLGVELPRTIYPPRPGNPLGFWESGPLVEAQDAFLETVGSTYRDTAAWPESALASPAALAFERRLVELLGDEYGDAPQFVLKDPRICRLMPLWLAALEALGAEPRVLLPIRNPLEVAASLRGRDERSDLTARSLLMWLRYVLDAERHSRAYPRSFASYDDLLRDWRSVTDRIGRDLSVAWPRASHLATVEIEAFLSTQARHHTVDTETLNGREDVPGWVKRAYAVLLEACAGGPVDTTALDEIRSDLDRADSAYGPLLAHADLQVADERSRVVAHAETIDELAAQLEGARDEAERLVTDLAGAKQGRAPKAPRRMPKQAPPP